MQSDFEAFADEVAEELAAPRQAIRASDFGDNNTKFLWYPFLPIGDYTALFASGGSGKTLAACKIAANVSTGEKWPDEEFNRKPENVLFISGEDSGEELKSRLQKSGADLNRIFIIDRIDSIGLNFSDGYEEVKATVRAYQPKLLVVDPWFAFIDENVDLNRVNQTRPLFQQIAGLAKTFECSIVLISHVNKKAQTENLNFGALGSGDFINAARSALTVVFDEETENARILIHSKSNYAAPGKSVRFTIDDGGGVKWAGFSDIDRRTLEAAARMKKTPEQVLKEKGEKEGAYQGLILALQKSANNFVPTKFFYDEFKKIHGEFIFGGGQPRKALEAVAGTLNENGYFLKICRVKKDGKTGNGFIIQRIDDGDGEQMNGFG